MGQDEGWRDPGEGEFAEELSRSAEAEKEAIAESPGEDADTRMRELNEIIRDPITASLNLAKNNFTTFQNELVEDYVANLSDNPELTRDIYMANELTGVIRLVDYEGGTD